MYFESPAKRRSLGLRRGTATPIRRLPERLGKLSHGVRQSSFAYPQGVHRPTLAEHVVRKALALNPQYSAVREAKLHHRCSGSGQFDKTTPRTRRYSHPTLYRLSRDAFLCRYLSYRSPARAHPLDNRFPLLICVSYSSHL
jgi:hypothetical protein